MALNKFEYTPIKISELPTSWQNPVVLDELQDFLQQNWEQRSVFYDDNEMKSNQQFLKIGHRKIDTNKYIGTIVFKGEQLNIYPRVFGEFPKDEDTNDLSTKHMLYNLVKWIEYCNRLTHPFIHISSELNDSEDLKELFITLYIGYVRKAIERGLYYQYVELTEDCTSIKGKFDIKDYFTRKIPYGQGDKFLCSYSNFEFDNTVNRIIKYTCKQLMNMTSKKNQKELRTILIRLNEVSDVQCKPSDCNGIRLSKMHRHFGIIISMSKMFLLNRISNYSIDTNESFCFLFPTDVLFEGFIGGFIKEALHDVGGKVILQEKNDNLINRITYGDRVTGVAFNMRRDILVEYNDKIFILDTKYKEISRFEDDDNYEENIKNEAKQGDLYQVITYASKAGLKDVYLLYPMYRYEENEEIFPIADSDFELFGATIKIHFIRIPFVFEIGEDEKIKQQLTDAIKSVFEVE